MLKGVLRALDSDQMESLHCGALRVLEQTGLQIQGEFLLRALADAGCRVDFAARRAWFDPDLVERQVAAQRNRYKLVRSSLWYPFCRRLPEDDVAMPDEFIVDYGYTTPWFYDHPHRRYRKATIQDQVDMIALGNALPCVKAVSSPMICGEFDPRMESIESARLLLLNTRKPGWIGTSCGKEVKYLAEMAALAVGGDRAAPAQRAAAVRGRLLHDLSTQARHALLRRAGRCASLRIPGEFRPHADPGGDRADDAGRSGHRGAGRDPRWSDRHQPDQSGRVLLLHEHRRRDGHAHHAGLLLHAGGDPHRRGPASDLPRALWPGAQHRAGLCGGQDAGDSSGVHEDVSSDGLRLHRQPPLADRGLDNGAVFSPTQAMIDLEMNEAIYRFARGMEVDDDTCAVDLIHELEFCQDHTYLETEHTAHRYRRVGWYPRLFDRAYCDHTQPAADEDEALLHQADEAWRKLVAAQEPLEVEPGFARELDRIVAAAHVELLADSR